MRSHNDGPYVLEQGPESPDTITGLTLLPVASPESNGRLSKQTQSLLQTGSALPYTADLTDSELSSVPCKITIRLCGYVQSMKHACNPCTHM